jgi:hypothetical protein
MSVSTGRHWLLQTAKPRKGQVALLKKISASKVKRSVLSHASTSSEDNLMDRWMEGWDG